MKNSSSPPRNGSSAHCFFGCAPAIFIVVALGLVGLAVPLSASAYDHIYYVDRTDDLPDADPADSVCQTPSGGCTLRAAIMQANFAPGANAIVVPPGTFTLTRAGYDDNALVGDLDITKDLTIQGAGSGKTIIDGNGAVTHDRVFQILSSAQNAILVGMTIRNGESLNSTVGTIGGGGVLIEGSGQVRLIDVILDSNTGQNGGGIYASFSAQGGSLTMDNVTLHANTAMAGGVGAGGGLFAQLSASVSQIVIRDSQVYGNTADGTGGGLYVSGPTTAHWSIERTQIYSNTGASGGAIGNFVPVTLSDSNLHDNHANFDGGGIEAFKQFVILRTTLNANSAGRFGGGIFALQTAGAVPSPTPAPANEFGHIEKSTLSGNSAQYGAGIYHDGFITPGSFVTLINSTVSGNTVFRVRGGSGTADGGGIYMYGAGSLQMRNTTIATNRVQIGFGTNIYDGHGGGIFVTAGSSPSPSPAPNVDVQNSIIANNTRGNNLNPDGSDDCNCSGAVGTLAYDLIRDMTNCFVTGPQGGNITGQDPLLGPLQDNGGPTLTQALLSGSPAINTAAPGGAINDLGAPLVVDQRGATRPQPAGGRSDIGAFEVQPGGASPSPTPTSTPVTTPPPIPTPTSTPAPTATPTSTPGGSTTPTATPTATPGSLGNVSTRLQIGTGNNVLFAGFIIQGSGSKTVLIRSIGPSLTGFGVPGAMSDPKLELHDANNLIGMNDNWQTTQLGGVITSDQVAAIQNSGFKPNDPAEPAIIATLPAGSYTAIVDGVGGAQGVATVELYDLSPNNGATLANISTRGFIQKGDNVMIGGFIIGGQSLKVIVIAVGPSLAQFGINNALTNPTLELHDANGTLAGNDNWQTTQLGGIITSDQSGAIQNSGFAPTDPAESAIIATLAPGLYTAIAQGAGSEVGVGVIQVFTLP